MQTATTEGQTAQAHAVFAPTRSAEDIGKCDLAEPSPKKQKGVAASSSCASQPWVRVRIVALEVAEQGDTDDAQTIIQQNYLDRALELEQLALGARRSWHRCLDKRGGR